MPKSQAILRDLIGFNTISNESNLALIDYCELLLNKAGARIQIFPNTDGTKANLFASVGPDNDHGIVLSGHTDVVPVAGQNWHSDPFEMLDKDDKLYGRGTCDMKGFIAAALEAAPRLSKLPLQRPIHFALTYDEETGCLGGAALVKALEQNGQKASAVIVGEPTEMRIIEGHKGMCEYTTHFEGRAGHGSRPELGVNAAEYAARYVMKLIGLRDRLKNNAPADSEFVPPYCTINVGGIHSGIAHNVIADKARVEWEMRPVQPGESETITTKLQAYCDEELLPAMRAVWPDSNITLETLAEVIGFTPATENEARDIITTLTGAGKPGLVSFGTEAGLFQQLGMSVVVCGPGSIEQAHKPNEFIAKSELIAAENLIERLGQHCC